MQPARNETRPSCTQVSSGRCWIDEQRRARAVEQPGAWLRLQDERWAARRCIRAATALVVAVRERDTARLRACIEVFEEANQVYEGFSA